MNVVELADDRRNPASWGDSSAAYIRSCDAKPTEALRERAHDGGSQPQAGDVSVPKSVLDDLNRLPAEFLRGAANVA